jgi:hypothetical protein
MKEFTIHIRQKSLYAWGADMEIENGKRIFVSGLKGTPNQAVQDLFMHVPPAVWASPESLEGVAL